MVIRFAGDSAESMRLTGKQRTKSSAVLGNETSAYSDFPSEIRPLADAIPGVSGFQIIYSREDILTSGQCF